MILSNEESKRESKLDESLEESLEERCNLWQYQRMKVFALREKKTWRAFEI